jgi:hypothetical protein
MQTILNIVCFLLGDTRPLNFKIQTPENHSEESIHHSDHEESLKSRIVGI